MYDIHIAIEATCFICFYQHVFALTKYTNVFLVHCFSHNISLITCNCGLAETLTLKKIGTSYVLMFRNQSVELKSIENDYIKNLQQQVYFLEMEANYLREQARKATEIHPKMSAEAERMISKLRVSIHFLFP